MGWVGADPKTKGIHGRMPCDTANFLSKASFWYSLPLLKVATKRTLTENDLWEVVEDDSSKETSSKVEQLWEQEKKQRKDPSLFRALIKAFSPILLMSMLFRLIWTAIIIFTPIYLVHNIIAFVQDANAGNSGWIYAAAFFVTAMIQSMASHQVFWLSFRGGARMRSAVSVLIYEKSLRLKSPGNIGEISTLISNDCMRLQDFGQFFNFVWDLPVQMATVGALLIWKVGWAGALGLVFMIAITVYQVYTGTLVRMYRGAAVHDTAQRVKLMSEILMAIKLVKFYAWEAPFAQRVTQARAIEVKEIRHLAFLRATNFILAYTSASLTTLLVFAAYVGSGHTLNPEDAFVILALINSVRYGMNMLPLGIKSVAESRVATQRVQAFLLLPELPPRQPYIPLSAIPLSTPVIEVADGDFVWEEGAALTLRNVNVKVPRGQLVAVVGPVGSGKSTLLHAIMEQITRKRGTVAVRGGLAYVPQQAWIQNMTMRENILFGLPYDEAKYKATIRACALVPDLRQLVGGDQTEIGERGINLSGGQKQRVSIARAVYADQDIVLLDDPLSAVDQHVGKHIFEHCIRTVLSKKTVILVTHQLQYLPKCDNVIVMAHGGIAAQGTFTELMSKVDFASLFGQHVDLSVLEVAKRSDELQSAPSLFFMEEYSPAPILDPAPTFHHNSAATLNTPAPPQDTPVPPQITPTLIQEPTSPVLPFIDDADIPSSPNYSEKNFFAPGSPMGNFFITNVAKATFLALDPTASPALTAAPALNASTALSAAKSKEDEEKQKDAGKLTQAEGTKEGTVDPETFKHYILHGGVIAAVVVAVLHVCSQGSNVASFWFLTYWTTHPENSNLNIGIYAMLTGLVLVLCMSRELIYQSFTLRASTNIHNIMFRTILRAPMSFFDVTPMGRILNRFSTDMDIVDYTLPDMSMQALHYGCQVVGIIGLISAFLHYMPLLLLPMGALYLLAQHYYRNANRDIKRMDSMSKSPIFQHIVASLQGLAVLRAFRQEERFSTFNRTKIDHMIRSGLQLYMIQQWLGSCLDFICICLVFATAALCVGLRDQITPAQAGLAVTYSLQLAGVFQWTIRTVADSEAQMTSVERMLQYCNPELEAGAQNKPLKKGRVAPERLPYEAPPVMPNRRPSSIWPHTGVVKFDHVTVEYAKGAPVLVDMTFTTKPMEKIGIVGRTGAGKSTIALALFRMMECSVGHIEIDGQDISLIGTHDLRSRLAIIPQDPVLFEGTIRSNLDPFGTYDDAAIWKTLQQIHLDEIVGAFPQKLLAPVDANGDNWSLGQRQLICIGRALLKHCKVLVLDEATAAVDLETDHLIQETIRTNFNDCTILTIAHRLNTIIDSDRVMVLDRGRIVEFGHPAHLLRGGPDGAVFRGMVEKMGPAAFARLSLAATGALARSAEPSSYSGTATQSDCIMVEEY